ERAITIVQHLAVRHLQDLARAREFLSAHRRKLLIGLRSAAVRSRLARRQADHVCFDPALAGKQQRPPKTARFIVWMGGHYQQSAQCFLLTRHHSCASAASLCTRAKLKARPPAEVPMFPANHSRKVAAAVAILLMLVLTGPAQDYTTQEFVFHSVVPLGVEAIVLQPAKTRIALL